MVYLDPKIDIAFKKLFGNIVHKEVLISFLNSVLERVEGTKIIDVIINDPANLPEIRDLKSSIVDVRCTDQSGHQYIVEMQVVPQDYYPARAQYYSALALSRQLARRGDYRNLVPVIFVGILNFSLFSNPSYLTHHFILDSVTHERALKHLEFHFVELSKFNLQEEQLNTILEKWIYLLKNADIMQERPESFQEPELDTALDLLAQGHWSVQELEAYDKYLDAERSQAGQLSAAKREAVHEIALELLRDGLDVARVAKITKLSIEQVEELRKNVK